ncbi:MULTISPECIES: response regulator transcription factor [Enterococcus]|jgi:DNA-binding response OmpR family regulator|uniref:DNA-binding response regulator n=1 Tax=Enterococcus dispar ATCC 51266 TaxID=1139219 RepID=S1P159_9ENTE|nr:response regulator transcription factor [Enterococcus dispar]EOT38968.1 DNA-binding response regulator [Enterococcus dispar ATCC 51266]EOW86131.1 DNA-binding response regulator [Enterococcus dispar ATCC 51266]MCU7357050.1 response regulator transcription factor [Enterococcus dispar]MDT2705154.1 response regulator transcription factor [Enterococcus dispar]WCG32404.1 response regulator transcription factor [Enterococcus dispar]
MRNEKILVVDDDPAIRRLIWKSLQSTGILIYQSDSIEKTIDIMSRVAFDLFLLDISLEYENDGYHLAQMIRSENSVVPIIFLSGKTQEQDIVTGLETGADLYLTKPFSPAILKAQVLASLDRSLVIKKHTGQQVKTSNSLTLGEFTYDKKRYQLYKNDVAIKLSSKETQLMQFFMENPNQVFSKEQIYQSVWNEEKTDTNTIMVFINHLRNKIEADPKNAKYLQTVWGIGYTFVAEN